VCARRTISGTNVGFSPRQLKYAGRGDGQRSALGTQYLRVEFVPMDRCRTFSFLEPER
jgi:hypothetical protein